MLLWTSMPAELVLEGFDTIEYNWMEVDLNGVKMVVEPVEGQPGYGKIVRLLSPNPRDYLKAEFSPGSVVPLLSNK